MKITIENKEYKLNYDMNAWIEIGNRYETMKEAIEKITGIGERRELRGDDLETLRFVLMVGINNGMDYKLSEEDAGKLLSFENISDVSLDILNAMAE